VIKKNLNPQWREWELDLNLIGGIDAPFHILVKGIYCGVRLLADCRTQES
jgi:hypothetical protein